MRRMLTILVATFAVLSGSAKADDDNARLQIIHNAADPAAAVVDIYVNGVLFKDNIAFRTATEFRTVPAGVILNVAIAPGNSSSADDAVAVIPVELEEEETYVAIANGVLDPSAFDGNPDGAMIDFQLFARHDVREKARWRWFTDLLIFHGATDAPTVDVVNAGKFERKLAEDLSYGEFARYATVLPVELPIDIRVGDATFASFTADLSGLRGGAAVVFASGFINIAQGEPFGLFAALPNGVVVELPQKQTFAELQVIHNAADTLAGVVDIYVNDQLYQNDFAFRTATEFRTVPAGVELNVQVAPATSTSSADAIASFPVTLAANQRYVAIANGILGTGYAPNPDGNSIDFTIFAQDNIRNKSNSPGMVDFIAFHGATDAPTVDVVARDVAMVVNDLSYGSFSDYAEVPAQAYTLDVTPGNDNDFIVASFEADLSGLAGGAAIVFASGFLNDSQGPAFGLFAALPNGTVVTLPAVDPFAELQIIHNAADPGAASVDIYVNGALYEDNFDFRAATEFRTVPAGVELEVQVAPATSSSAAEAIASFAVTLANGKRYVAVANGVLGGGFTANPDGMDIAFSVYPTDGIVVSSGSANTVNLIAFHGATDAPTVDVVARNVGTVVDDLTYGMFSQYVSVPAQSYVLDVTPGNDNSIVVASFEADLSGLGGGAAVVFASGFLDDSQGPGFGLFAALPNGAVVSLPPYAATARLQVIHNAADPAAEVVDIYVNGALYEDDFAFRAATEFRTVPADVELLIGVAPAASSSASQAIATTPVTLEAGKTYIAIANGVLDPSAFESNPDDQPIGFSLYATDAAKEESGNSHYVSIAAFHGATDAPAVDIWARDKYFPKKQFADLGYGQFSEYESFRSRKYTLFVTPAGNPWRIVGIFSADLRNLGGGAAIVFASGFLNDGQGEGFGLFAALPNGVVVSLERETWWSAKSASEVLMGGLNEETLPQSYSLAQNYPNPFNPSTTISFALPKASDVNLTVYNILGQQVETLYEGRMEAGQFDIEWDASRYASGVYFYRLTTSEFAETRKMVLVK